MIKIMPILLILPLLCCHREQQIKPVAEQSKPIEKIDFPQMPKDGDISFSSSYDEKIFKETGKRVFNEGMLDVRLNDEVIAIIEGIVGSTFTYSIKNGQLIVAVDMHVERCTIMYTIDIESKMIKKKERLNTPYTYKDSDLKISIIGKLYDTNTAIMQYTWRGKTNKVILPANKKFGFMFNSYISESGHLIACHHNGLDIFSMDKKKFIYLGRFDIMHSWDFSCTPLNEYVVYAPYENFTNDKVYLYRYAEEELYATRYQKGSRKEIKDTIISNMKKGNIYEQFLPLTRVENIDSMVNANSTKARVDSIKKILDKK